MNFARFSITLKEGCICGPKEQNIMQKENHYFWLFNAYMNETPSKMYIQKNFFWIPASFNASFLQVCSWINEVIPFRYTRIRNPVEHLRWIFLQKELTPERVVFHLDVILFVWFVHGLIHVINILQELIKILLETMANVINLDWFQNDESEKNNWLNSCSNEHRITG